MKPNKCRNCPLSRNPGPLLGEYTSPKVEVLFLGHYPTRFAISRNKAFAGFEPFLSLIPKSGISSFGITNCWKCTLGETTDVHWHELHPHCLSLLREEIVQHAPEVVVPIGGLALEILQDYWNFQGSKPGRVKGFKVLPVLHPSNPEAGESISRGFELLQKCLRKVT